MDNELIQDKMLTLYLNTKEIINFKKKEILSYEHSVKCEQL